MYLYHHHLGQLKILSKQNNISTPRSGKLDNALILHHICAQLEAFIVEGIARIVIWLF
jgi:hypothetical protein